MAAPDRHGESDLCYELVDVVKAGQLPPAGLVYAETVQHGRELVAVFGIVDAAGRGAQYVHALIVEAGGEVVGNLAAHRQYGAVGLLELEYVHDALEGELVEV